MHHMSLKPNLLPEGYRTLPQHDEVPHIYPSSRSIPPVRRRGPASGDTVRAQGTVRGILEGHKNAFGDNLKTVEFPADTVVITASDAARKSKVATGT